MRGEKEDGEGGRRREQTNMEKKEEFSRQEPAAGIVLSYEGKEVHRKEGEGLTTRR